MKSILHIAAALLLLVTGVGALYGGWNLIVHPEGDNLPLSLAWLDSTWLHDYPIQGITLLVVSGILGLFALAAIVIDLGNSALLVVAHGFVIVGWTVVQLLLVHTLQPLHFVLGLVGVALILLGLRIGQLELQYDEHRHPHRR